jgi:type VI secretion system protein ImpE
VDASACYKRGDLQAALAAQFQQVKDDPSHEGKRLFLFELLAFAGELDRAQRQIEALLTSETEHDLPFVAYRQLLDGERARRRLFGEGVSPRFFAEPPEHVRLRLEAVTRLREGRSDEAAELMHRADEAAPPLKGTLNGRAFGLLRDCDDFFGTVLELLHLGSYYWLPLELVAEVAAPGRPGWRAATLLLAAAGTGRRGDPGSASHPARHSVGTGTAQAQGRAGGRHLSAGPLPQLARASGRRRQARPRDGLEDHRGRPGPRHGGTHVPGRRGRGQPSGVAAKRQSDHHFSPGWVWVRSLGSELMAVSV